MESRHLSAGLVDVAGTAPFLMSHGASMVQRGQHPSPPHHHPQLHSLRPSGTALLRQGFATGTTRKRMISTGTDSLVAHPPLVLAPLQTTQQEAKKVKSYINDNL